MEADEASRVKKLQEKNKRRKRLLAEAELDKPILREALGGKLTSPARRLGAASRVRRKLGVSEHGVMQEL